ncbi:MAG: hypothetical protein ACOZQL_14050 [Myxococcota bacterium]
MTTETKQPGPASFVFAVLINVVFLVFIASHQTWRPLLDGAVTDDFPRVLWAMYLGAAVQIVGNLLLLQHATPGARRLLDFIFAAVGLVGAVVMFQVFPFDLARFGGWAPVLARVLLIIGIVGGALGTLVKFVGLFIGRKPPRLAHR